MQAPALKILLITRNFPPVLGGMERLNKRLFQGLVDYAQVAICAPIKNASLGREAHTVASVSLQPLSWFFVQVAIKSLWTSWHFKPDMVMAGSGIVAPFAWLAAKLCGAKFIIYVHGLDLIANHRLYQYGWLPWIRKADLVIANSTFTAKLAQQKGVPEQHIKVICPGVDIPNLSALTENSFRQQHDLTQHKILLSVGRLTERKGILDFIKYCLPQIKQQIPEIKLVIIGDAPTHALKKYHGCDAAAIMAAAEAHQVAAQILFVGRCDDARLSMAYAAADVHVFPIKAVPHDVEGFGMVALEAAAHGLPTIAFAEGGVVDAVQDTITGLLVPPGDYAAFTEAIVHCLNGKLYFAIQERTQISQLLNDCTWDSFNHHIHQTIDLLNAEK